MEIGSQALVVIVLIGGIFAAYRYTQWRGSKPKILPPPRTKSTERPYQETNSVARLFLETVSLREREANWGLVMKGLNAEDEPRIRTLLLELRALDVSNPRRALEAIEVVCIESKQDSEQLTRADLLERAHSRLRGA